VTGAIAAAREALGKKRPAGSRDVTAGDVEFAAMALIHAGAQPHPRLLVRITGGSLSTVSRLFQEWFAAFAQRSLDPADPRLDLPTKVTLRVKLLVAHLEAAVREQLLGVRRPEDVFAAAAALGERQALKEQLALVSAERDRLTQEGTSLTYRLKQVETQLQAEVQRREATTAALHTTLSELTQVLERTRAQLAARRAASKEDASIRALVADVRGLLRRRRPAASRTGRRPPSAAARGRGPGRGRAALPRIPRRPKPSGSRGAGSPRRR
jgi:hypothetical protein